MAKRHIFVDKTELVLIYPQGKKYVSANVTYEQIISIRFKPCREFKLFFPVDSEMIEIVTRKHGSIVFKKLKEKEYFEEYKKELAAFAAKNRVSLADELQARP